MTCSHCNSGETGRRGRRTSFGYRTFVCRACRSLFNERTGTGFNDLQYPTDIVLMGSVRTQTATRNQALSGARKQLSPSLAAGRATTTSRACNARGLGSDRDDESAAGSAAR